MARLTHPTQERLLELLNYNPVTGHLTWQVSFNNHMKAGKRAGTFCKGTGYRKIRIDGKCYREHRLIWIMMMGELDNALDVDHEDRIRDNNRWGNLRIATQAQNAANTLARSSSQTGLKGVCVKRDKFEARIETKGQRFYLGSYKTALEAHRVYVEKAKELQGAYCPFV